MRVTRIPELVRGLFAREQSEQATWENLLEATQGVNNRAGRRRVGIYGPTRGRRYRMDVPRTRGR